MQTLFYAFNKNVRFRYNPAQKKSFSFYLIHQFFYIYPTQLYLF